MLDHLLHPLEVDPKYGEPFLRLPSPFNHIIITPLRDTDKPAKIEVLNDHRVIQMLSGPPYPYLPEHEDAWAGMQKKNYDAGMQELEEAGKKSQGGPLNYLEFCPVSAIREVKADGTSDFIGDIGIRRCTFEGLPESEEKKKLVAENMAKKIGDPTIVWTFGNFLAPSHHGKGIMTAVVAAILKAWVIPRYNAHIIEVTAFKGNIGSVRVFEKNGFKLEKTIEDCVVVRGERKGLHILRWHLDDQ